MIYRFCKNLNLVQTLSVTTLVRAITRVRSSRDYVGLTERRGEEERVLAVSSGN